MKENKELQKIENIMEIETPIDPKSKEFEKVMFIYQVALKEINTKLEILKDEFKLFYEYNLIDHINTRIKSPESITKKMKDKNLKYTYKEMIKNINDIAGKEANASDYSKQNITINGGEILYKLTSDNLKEMGLKDVKLGSNEEYLVKYNIKDVTVEVYNTSGYENNGTTVYSLSELEKI